MVQPIMKNLIFLEQKLGRRRFPKTYNNIKGELLYDRKGTI